MEDSVLCGWRVRSELPLPELPPWAGDEREADIVIRMGDQPPPIENPSYLGPLLQIGQDGSSRFSIPSVATYAIDGRGEVVTVAPALGAEASACRAFVFGVVTAILCQRRGLLPLHACCVGLDGPEGPVAVAFAGRSGIGKSTLAAAFLRRGLQILADDVTVLEATPTGRPLVRAGPPRLKLWRDVLDSLGRTSQGLEPVRESMGKYSLPLGSSFTATPLPLVAIHHLERVYDDRHVIWVQQRGLSALELFLSVVYQVRALSRFDGGPAVLHARSMRIASAIDAHWALSYRSGVERLDDLIDRIIVQTRLAQG